MTPASSATGTIRVRNHDRLAHNCSSVICSRNPVAFGATTMFHAMLLGIGDSVSAFSPSIPTVWAPPRALFNTTLPVTPVKLKL